MKSHNNKVNRTLSTIALVCKDLPEEKLREIHKAINDDKDGYDYDFLTAALHYKTYVRG